MRTLAVILAGGQASAWVLPRTNSFFSLTTTHHRSHPSGFSGVPTYRRDLPCVNHKDLPTIQEEILEAYHFSKILKLVIGGRLRQDSVRNGLEAIDEPCDVVTIHDAAVLSFPAFVEKSIFLMEMFDAIIPAIPARDTIKAISKEGFVLRTLERDSLWHVQTPQTFKYDLITKAYREGMSKKLFGYDDSTFMEYLGKKSRWLKAHLTTSK